MRWFLLTTAFLWAGLVAVAAPQQETDRQNPPEREVGSSQDVSKSGPAEVGITDEKTKKSSIRSSQLVGMEIQNSQGEEIGEVNDLVLDSETGKIRYAAVSYGGVLGVGDKLFAVPWEAFRAKQSGDDPQEWVLMLDVTEQELENAQGFNEDNWPDFGDSKFTDTVDKRYGVQRDSRGGGVNVDVRRGEGVRVDVNRDQQPPEEQRQNRNEP